MAEQRIVKLLNVTSSENSILNEMSSATTNTTVPAYDDVVEQKLDMDLNQVDNTSDVDKPISILTQSALDSVTEDYLVANNYHKIYTDGSEPSSGIGGDLWIYEGVIKVWDTSGTPSWKCPNTCSP